MQVTVEDVSALGRRMTVTVENANIEESVQQRLKSILPTVKVAGFRAGKVPLAMVAKSHGPSARNDVVEDLVQTSMREAFAQENTTPAGPPHVETMKEDKNSLIYVVNYEIFPELDKVNLDGIEIQKIVAEVQNEDLDNMIETLREQRLTWEPLKRGAQEGDGVTIDFVGSIDGEIFEGGSGDDVLVVIGNGTMLPEFENQLVDKKAGQDTTITLTFPEDYRAEHLAGKTAEFAITVKTVAKKKLPKLDKEFAELCGVDGGIAALKKEVHGNMERELHTKLKNENKIRVMDGLLNNNEIELPSAPVEREAEFLMEQAKQNLAQQGVNVEAVPLDVENFRPTAERRVALSVLIGKIISDHNITPDEARIKAAITDIAASYEDPDEVVQHYKDNTDKLSQIQMMVVEDTVVDLILDSVKVEETSSTFAEVMNPSAAAE